MIFFFFIASVCQYMQAYIRNSGGCGCILFYENKHWKSPEKNATSKFLHPLLRHMKGDNNLKEMHQLGRIKMHMQNLTLIKTISNIFQFLNLYLYFWKKLKKKKGKFVQNKLWMLAWQP